MLPSDLTTIIVTDTYSDISGNPVGGTVTFTPTSQLTDPGGNVVFPRSPVVVGVSKSTGNFSVRLPCTDSAGLTPSPWAYVCEISIQGMDPAPFTVLFPSSLGASVRLRTVAPAVPPPPPLGTAVYSVNGQSGAVVVTASGLGAASAAALTAETTRAGAAETANASAVTAETTRAETAEAGLLPLAGGTMTGNIAMGGTHKVTGLAAGSSSGDAVAFQQLPASLPPSGTAGGVLTGTYPNPGISTLNQSTTGTAAGLSSTLAIGSGGTGATSGPAALTALGADSRYGRLAAASTYTADQYFKSGRPWFDVIAFGADPSGVSDSTSAINAAILAAVGGNLTPSSSTRTALGPVYLPAGIYKVTSDILIQSVSGFQFTGAGANCATLKASGTGFTTAVLNIDGSLDGTYAGFQVTGDLTEGAGSAGIPNAVNLTWTTGAARSTSANTFRNIRIRALNFVNGLTQAAPAGTSRQVDGTTLDDIVITGQQAPGGWSAAARTDTGVCSTSTSTPNTVGDTAAVTADLGLPVHGPGIPSGTTITAVSAGTGYTISGSGATATAGGVTFVVGTSNWQQGFTFGNGTSGNQYNYAAYNCSASLCYYGYLCSASGFEVYGAQPFGNFCDFSLNPGTQIAVQGIQSQNSQMLITGSGGSGVVAVGFRDVQFKGWSATAPPSNWVVAIAGGAASWEFSNVQFLTGGSGGYSPVLRVNGNGAPVNATFTGCAAQNAIGSVFSLSSGANVTAIDYVQISAASGTQVTATTAFWTNSGSVALNSGLAGATAASRYAGATASGAPGLGTFATGDFIIDQTGSIWVCNTGGSPGTWTQLAAQQNPSVTWITATGTTTWTKPAGAQVVDVFLLGDGGGGGSGGIQTTGNAGGGGGGGGGGVTTRTFAAADLTSTVTVTVGAGGAGGTLVSGTAGASGTNGGSGTSTSFGTFAFAHGGVLGGAGTTAGGGAGTFGVATNPGTAGGAGGAAAAGGAVAAAAGAPGGGGGGGANTGTAFNGGNSSFAVMGNSANAGAAGVAGGATPTSGTQPAAKGTPSCGGGGGAGANGAGPTAQAGATAFYGGGGGGGGGAFIASGTGTSGAGGAGGPGWALIITHFA